jgi:hypothetical protein
LSELQFLKIKGSRERQRKKRESREREREREREVVPLLMHQQLHPLLAKKTAAAAFPPFN